MDSATTVSLSSCPTWSNLFWLLHSTYESANRRAVTGTFVCQIHQKMVKPNHQKNYGDRRQVYAGLARQTTGHLMRKDLVLSKSGKVVSRKKQQIAQTARNNLKSRLVKKN